MNNYDYKDQSDQLESEHCQNPILKCMAKNPSWRSNAKEGIQTLKHESIFMSLGIQTWHSNAKAKFLFGVRMLIWAFERQSL